MAFLFPLNMIYINGQYQSPVYDIYIYTDSYVGNEGIYIVVAL